VHLILPKVIGQEFDDILSMHINVSAIETDYVLINSFRKWSKEKEHLRKDLGEQRKTENTIRLMSYVYLLGAVNLNKDFDRKLLY